MACADVLIPPSPPPKGEPKGILCHEDDAFLTDDYIHNEDSSFPPFSLHAATKSTVDSEGDPERQSVETFTVNLGDPEEGEDEEANEEVANLLHRGSARSTSFLNGWQLKVSPVKAHVYENDLDLYVSHERVRGMDRIRLQLSQAAQLFKELTNLLNEQQEDFELLDSGVSQVKDSTGLAVKELGKADAYKRRARRRAFFMVTMTLLVLAIVVYVYFLQYTTGTTAAAAAAAAAATRASPVKLAAAHHAPGDVIAPASHHRLTDQAKILEPSTARDSSSGSEGGESAAPLVAAAVIKQPKAPPR